MKEILVKPLAAASAAVLLVALTACDAKDEVSEAPSPAPATTTASRWTTTGPGSKLSQEQLDKALLSMEDLPEGSWEVFNADEKDVDDSVFDGVEPAGCRKWFQERNGNPAVKPGRSSSQAAFRDGGSDRARSRTIQYRIDQFATPEKAQQVMTVYRGCSRAAGASRTRTPRAGPRAR